MSTDLPKAYDPHSVEAEANRAWTDEKLFHAEPTDRGEPYAIVIPPPNVTAALHLGHALNNTLQDIVIRWRRMAGDNAVWIPGTDHAGIATQTVVEKRVLAEEGKRRTDFKRDEFVAKIQAWKDEYERRITEQLKAMGCSCDYERQAFTMDDARARAVREAFFRLFKDGLIYRGKRLVNWDPATQTALADDEVEMEEIDGHFYYLKYPIVEESDEATKRRSDEGLKTVTVATTRPETMLGDTAVAINPRDPRAAQLRGKKVRLPIVNRIVPIIEDDYVVLPDPKSDDPKAKFATGFLKVTPAHDPNDYDIGLRHKLPMINVLAPDGTISDQHGWPREDFEQGDAGFLLGQDRFEARAAVVEWFRKNNLLEEVRPYRHSVGHSYRSHVPIEPYLSDQWYCKVTDERLAGAALRAMSREQFESATPSPRTRGEGQSAHEDQTTLDSARRSPLPPAPSPQAGRGSNTWQGQLKFFPARYAKTFQTWHKNIRDWCISRQLWWGHRIPVWRLTGPLEFNTPMAAIEHAKQLEALEKDLARWVSDDRVSYRRSVHTGTEEFSEAQRRTMDQWFACLRHPKDDEIIRRLESVGFAQDPDVLDTWFSSGLWPMSVFDWPDITPELQKWNPTHTLCTAREIITLWVSRMVMFNLYFLDRLPFAEVFIHSMIQDGEGRKMSKSLNNGVDPLDIIHSHGADAMRFTLTLMATNTQDVRMPVEKDAATGKNTSPKFDIGRNFCNKVWNASRFVLTSLPPLPPGEGRGEGARGVQSVSTTQHPLTPTLSQGEREQSLPDRWILSRLATTVRDVEDALSNYRFDQYAKLCYDFFWRDFCDWYVEAVKPAMKDAQRAPQTAQVLAAALDAALRLMHPMIPFITETIWWRLNDGRPDRSLPKLAGGNNKRLIVADWPRPGESLIDPAAEAVFAQLQEITGAIRNVRNEYKVEPKKPVTVSILAPDERAGHVLQNRSLIETLATCSIAAAGPAVKQAVNAARAVLPCGVEIFIEGLTDPQAEQQRLSKRCEELKRQMTALRGRLSNESYIAKAPAHLVQQTKDQLAQAEAEFVKLGCQGN